MTPLHIASGAWSATLLPAQGAAFAALRHDGRDLLVPVPSGGDPNAGFWGAFWMLPWANRLDAGELPFGGTTHLVPINRPEDNTAIHGLARDRPWRVEGASATRAALAQDLDERGLPFRYAARLAIELGADSGLSLSLAVTNTADAPFPCGLGWHPWFARLPGTRLRFRAATMFGRDARTLPVLPRGTAGVDADDADYVGLDTHFAGWDGVADILRPDGLALRLAATGAWSANLQVFAPPFAAALCVEPQSHVPDAPNRPDFAVHGPLAVLAPGESLRAQATLAIASHRAPESILVEAGTLAAK